MPATNLNGKWLIHMLVIGLFSIAMAVIGILFGIMLHADEKLQSDHGLMLKRLSSLEANQRLIICKVFHQSCDTREAEQ